MKTTTFACTAVYLTLAIGFVSAAHAGNVTFDWATIGNPGNADDARPQRTYGAVDYAYRIGKTEVTNAQYTEFLNAVDPTGGNALNLYSTSMVGIYSGIENTGTTDGARYVAQAGRENNPIFLVSWYSSIRFINWLGNGQPTDGTGTENGAYTLEGGTPTPTNGLTVTRNAGATYWLPSEDEWYKAAYYDPASDVYYEYANGSNTIPASDRPENDPSAANYLTQDGYAISGTMDIGPNPFTDVGAYAASTSPYGTFDQDGNVREWNEANFGSGRGIRSGSWGNYGGNSGALARTGLDSSRVYLNVGFRVARSIPEPSSLLLGTLASVGLLMRRRLT